MPPEGVPYLETKTGLKFWLSDRMAGRGEQSSVLTDDPAISMHGYNGGIDRGWTYLIRYHGLEFGFFRQSHDCGEYPCKDMPARRADDGTSEIFTITGLGTPVWDEAATRTAMPDGRCKYDLEARKAGKSYVTGITFSEYNSGKRSKFESAEQQKIVLELIPELFSGLMGNLRRLDPKFHKIRPVKSEYSKRVLREVRWGKFHRFYSGWFYRPLRSQQDTA